jgi:hypothetical protein
MAKNLGMESVSIEEQIQQIVRSNTINESSHSIRSVSSDTEETDANDVTRRRNVSNLSKETV